MRASGPARGSQGAKVITPNIAAARAFLRRFDPEADFFTVQTFDDTGLKRGALAKIVHIDPANGALDSLAGLNEDGTGIYFAVNATDGKGRQAHNVQRVRAVFLDLDGAPLAPVLAAGVEPHIVVESSPGKYHVYWLTDDCPLDQFERVQRALARRFGGDPSVHDLPRVLRVPGFLHRKGEPFLSHVVDGVGFNGPPYALAEIAAALKLELDAPEQARPPSALSADGKIVPGNRHPHLFAMGRSMANKGLSPEAVAAALAAENAARCDPPLAAADVDYLAGRAFTAKHAQGWQDAPLCDDHGADDALPPPHADDAPAGPEWPAPLAPEAFHGVAGDFVKLIEPTTESDPAAILLQFLVMFGAVVGRGPHYWVEATRHGTNLFAVMVGKSSKARKGTSKDRVVSIIQQLPGWMGYVQGLSSGEGLKYHVRDPREEVKVDKNGNRTVEVVDIGVEDKRLLVIESEFAQPLKAVERAGNTLSPTVREAWDSGNLRTLTKNDPVTATGAHICILGHIVADELRRELAATDLANGFANRFLFVAVKRSKLLPFGGDDLDQRQVDDLVRRLTARLNVARSRDRITMTEGAKTIWAAVYPDLSEGHDGLHGSVTARAEAQCIRIALIYALLDAATQIDSPHLEAALAVWRYCDDTAKHIFGASLGDRTADEILRRLEIAGNDGLTRTEIRDLFGRHRSAEQIGAALELLKRKGKATCATVTTRGRPSEVWKATK